MPNLAVLEEIEKGELRIAIDDAREAQDQPEPGTPGPVTYDAATQTLSVAVMPDHSTTLHAFRQPLGGAPELAGSSPTTTVSVVQFGPLTPGVTYEFWLVGHTQSAGEGPESNHVTHAVPVGP